MRQQSPIPGHMIRDSRWGHRVPGHDEAALKAAADDQTFAERYAELAESYDLHVEVGSFSWNGPPFFASIMPQVIYDRLAGPQDGAVTAAKLGWGALSGTPGYADGQLTRRAAIKHAQTNYDAAQPAALPTAAVSLPQ